MTTPSEPFDPSLDDFEINPPVWPKWIGGISIGFASLGLVCSVCGVGWMAFGASMMPPDPSGGPPPPFLNPSPLIYVSAGAGTLIALLLLGAGILTVTRQPAGRITHLVWVVLGIISGAFGMWVQMQMNAATKQWALDNPSNPMAQGINAQGGGGLQEIIGYTLAAVMSFGWPLFCGVWFGAIKTKPWQFRHRQEPGSSRPA